jgi:hypothetical protein
MARRVTATFSSHEAADRAAAALANLGVDRNQISTLARGGDTGDANWSAERREVHEVIEPAREVGDAGAPLTTTDEEDVAKGAAVGAAIGAVAGITAGLLSIMVPGVGLVTAGGALAWALGGMAGAAAAGAVAGGIIGGLHDLGIPEHHARTYEERVRQGDVLMTAVIPDIDEDRVRDLLNQHGAEYVTFAASTVATTDYKMPAGSYSSAAAVDMPSDMATRREAVSDAPADTASTAAEEEEEVVRSQPL